MKATEAIKKKLNMTQSEKAGRKKNGGDAAEFNLMPISSFACSFQSNKREKLNSTTSRASI